MRNHYLETQENILILVIKVINSCQKFNFFIPNGPYFLIAGHIIILLYYYIHVQARQVYKNLIILVGIIILCMTQVHRNQNFTHGKLAIEAMV